VQETDEAMTTVGNEPPAGGSLAETFVLRLWETPDLARREAEALRGVVRHIRSGRSTTFADEESLLAFLRAEGRANERSIGGEP
jgi:hypothetical protein